MERITVIYVSEYLKRQAIEARKKLGWKVIAKVKFPDGTYEVTYFKQ